MKIIVVYENTSEIPDAENVAEVLRSFGGVLLDARVRNGCVEMTYSNSVRPGPSVSTLSGMAAPVPDQFRIETSINGYGLGMIGSRYGSWRDEMYAAIPSDMYSSYVPYRQPEPPQKAIPAKPKPPEEKRELIFPDENE